MNLDNLIDLAMENLIVTIVVAIVVVFIIFRLVRTARMYLGQKSYVKKARKLDRKKFNGMNLIQKTTRKRKKESNSFNKLRGRAKKWVKRYFGYKMEELPVFVRYSYGKLFKRSRHKLFIIIKNEKKTLKKINMKKGLRQIIDTTNKYACLDEMINFLHNLPEAIIEQQEYDIYAGDEDILITYQIK